MVVSIHQPNFLPWIGYFSKIAQSDTFVLIDHVQFIKGAVCNRNKIKANSGKEILLTVPVKLSNGAYQAFNEIEIDYGQKWQPKILNLIKAHYQKAQYFEKYYVLFAEILNEKHPNLASLNIDLIKAICSVLKISTPIYIASELDTDFGKRNDMNLNIVKYMNGDIYLSGHGAKKYNNENLFSENKIILQYLDFVSPIYPQLWGEFIPDLSIIDILFNVGEDQTIYYLNSMHNDLMNT